MDNLNNSSKFYINNITKLDYIWLNYSQVKCGCFQTQSMYMVASKGFSIQLIERATWHNYNSQLSINRCEVYYNSRLARIGSSAGLLLQAAQHFNVHWPATAVFTCSSLLKEQVQTFCTNQLHYAPHYTRFSSVHVIIYCTILRTTK